MATLIFEHDGWTVVTPAWAAASKDTVTTHICYPWSDASGLSFLLPMGAAAVGVAQTDLNMPIENFISLTKKGGVVDLRGRR